MPGLWPRFPAYEPGSRFDLADLSAELERSDVVLADLSGERPSCYYEVGVAETLGKPLLVIAREGTPIHQLGMRSLTRFYKSIAHMESVLEDCLAAWKEGGRSGLERFPVETSV